MAHWASNMADLASNMADLAPDMADLAPNMANLAALELLWIFFFIFWEWCCCGGDMIHTRKNLGKHRFFQRFCFSQLDWH